MPNIIHEDTDTVSEHSSFEIRTPKVVEVVRNHFDCMTITGARLEHKKGGIGCFGGFLDDHIFYSEQATGFQAADTRGPVISPLTLALLEDSSWYVANYQASTETPFGRGAGCQFARGGCASEVNDVYESKPNKGFHCSEIGELGCDMSHSYKAKCDMIDAMVRSYAYCMKTSSHYLLTCLLSHSLHCRVKLPTIPTPFVQCTSEKQSAAPSGPILLLSAASFTASQANASIPTKANQCVSEVLAMKQARRWTCTTKKKPFLVHATAKS